MHELLLLFIWRASCRLGNLAMDTWRSLVCSFRIRNDRSTKDRSQPQVREAGWEGWRQRESFWRAAEWQAGFRRSATSCIFGSSAARGKRGKTRPKSYNPPSSTNLYKKIIIPRKFCQVSDDSKDRDHTYQAFFFKIFGRSERNWLQI